LKLLFLLFLTLCLYADGFFMAETHFYNEEYEKAIPLYIDSAEQSQKPEAAYKLGWMYQNAKGTAQDSEKAAQWYKKAAEWEVSKTSRKDLYETIFATMNPLSDDESTNTALQHISGKFALRAYKPNYLLISHSNRIPKGETKFEENSPNPDSNGLEYIRTELQYQISLRADYVTGLFGFPQIWSAAYTQTSYWQIFIDSAPFREINYKPELFVTIPFGHKADVIGLKGVILGFKHTSNGQPVTDGNRTRSGGPVEGSRSRSWNRLYTQACFQWDNFFTEINIWHRISEDEKTDDNPDIEEYYGQGSIKVTYIYKKFLIDAIVNPSITKGLASGQLAISYPTPLSEDVFFYFQGFSGYGSSLIDYDQKVSKVGFGISISR